jgi:hypothetical protein
MPRKRTHCAPLALALDGSVLLNVSAKLDPAVLARVAEILAVKPAELFIGTFLPTAQRAQALSRIDDAAAEVAARIQGESSGLRTRRKRR